MKNIISNINKAFDHRIRLGIMSVLMVNDFVDFKTIRDLMGATDGNIASHTKALEKHNYIKVEKSFINRKPNTKYIVTDTGKKAFIEHLDALEKLLKASNDFDIGLKHKF
ncbi:winged helix-turn-helix domain-containing protein [Christiangramia sabulilitoris]|uniref:Transcriptional regulator n=1 Tax=Christiangramia sabulilitoris TaxID=2583991 RepID=A0A550I3B8_9FLAO|nr:transcriptional regulator [Christiangramia sabulilitoris]TRO65480.1 transcriptional regulator [Christiangramia sabulilitoris]